MKDYVLRKLKREEGFTLIETLVAISILMVSIVSPMSLAAQALSTAYYSRDQIAAYYLAQEGIEVVRSVRDGNILKLAEGQSANIFDGIPLNQPFTVNSLGDSSNPANVITICATNPCPPLQTNGSAFGYQSGWANSIFTRTLTAREIVENGNADPDELRITVTITWQAGNFQNLSFSINEDLYRWVSNGS